MPRRALTPDENRLAPRIYLSPHARAPLTLLQQADLDEVIFVDPAQYSQAATSDDSEVTQRTAADGWTAFSSSTVGIGGDNPADPDDLTDQQKARAVTLYYQNTGAPPPHTYTTCASLSRAERSASCPHAPRAAPTHHARARAQNASRSASALCRPARTSQP